MHKLLRHFIFSMLFLSLISTGVAFSKEKRFKFGTDPKIKQVRPGKPVMIKLKRSAKGSYSWELSGDNTEKIINADRKLREYLNVK